MSTHTRSEIAAAEELYRAAAADSLKDLVDTASIAIDAYLLDVPWYDRTMQEHGHALALHVAYAALRDARKDLAAAHAPFGQTPGDTP
jgi:hypothetical protein